MDMHYLNDNWTPDVAALGYDDLCRELVELTRSAQPPFAVAVYGGWGSGKTSLMRAIMCRLGGDLMQLAPEDSLIKNPSEADKRLTADWKRCSEGFAKPPNLKCVWFNPWQHQTEAHPMIALLHEIRRQFSVWMRSRQSAKKIGYVALKTGLRLLDDLAATATKALFGHKVQFGVDKIEKTGKTYEGEHYMNQLDSQRFQIHFETAIAHLVSHTKTANENGRLVIFIDDLDRCESGAAFKLLEAIKLYLSTRKCVFVFGLDQEHTVAALRKAGLDDVHQARSYLHKLFQAAVHLPRPASFEGFIQQQLENLQVAERFGLKPEALTGLARLLDQILEGNPRRIKNFLNQFMLRARVTVGRGLDAELLALLQALRNYFPEIYCMLEEAPAKLSIILAGMRHDRPSQAGEGLPTLAARVTYLPQMEETALTEDEVGRFAATEVHYADQRGLFLVLSRFKRVFIERFDTLGQEQLQEYLKP